jgi:cob(I)alamin adenosyltransferase
MKVYTKNGDKGNTQLLGGTNISKDNNRLECYGTIDELNAHIGHIYDQEIDSVSKKIMLKIQNTLFDLGSNIAFDQKTKNLIIPHLTENDVEIIEESIDAMEKNLPPLTNFILPSGHSTSSLCHIARTVCRRAERSLVRLMTNEKVEGINIKYLNRLSDFLFVLSRYILLLNKKEEILWQKKQ